MKQISGKVFIAMMVMMLFTMTACKNKKPVVDPLETSIQAAVDSTTEDENPKEGETSPGETTEVPEETQPEETAAAESESIGEVSGAGNQKPAGSNGGSMGSQGQSGSHGGSTGDQGQSGSNGGSVGDHETTGSSGWETEESPKYPWDLGGKQPVEYTWEEYLALSAELKDAFLKSFSDVRDYEHWRDNALKIYNGEGETTSPDEDWEKPTEEEPKLDLPWEKPGAKQPDQYIWVEFEVLSPELQMAFQNWFSSIDQFEAWMQKAQAQSDGSSAETMPWEMPGAKQPDQYTWAEFEVLSPNQQMAFQNWFDSIDQFGAWMKSAQGQQGSGENDDTVLPWEKSDAKQPDQYTWAEFEALSPNQQMAFQNWFGSIDEFDAWMKSVQGQQGSGENDDTVVPWEKPDAKQPEQYTWAEFEALSPDQQMAFQNWFGSIDAFVAWMQAAQGNASTEETMPWEVPEAKQPLEYTWAEFEALSPAQQMAFQNWFGSWEEFDKWLTANQP